MANINYYTFICDNPGVLKAIEGFGRDVPAYDDARTLWMSSYIGRGPEGFLEKNFPTADITMEVCSDMEMCTVLDTYKMKAGELVLVDTKTLGVLNIPDEEADVFKWSPSTGRLT